jgi:hypothetical protein
MSEHHAGELAYLDTFTGMVPAKVLAIEPMHGIDVTLR